MCIRISGKGPGGSMSVYNQEPLLVRALLHVVTVPLVCSTIQARVSLFSSLYFSQHSHGAVVDARSAQ